MLPSLGAEPHKQAIAEAGGLRVVLNGMDTFADAPSILLMACSAVRNLTAQSSTPTTPLRPRPPLSFPQHRCPLAANLAKQSVAENQVLRLVAFTCKVLITALKFIRRSRGAHAAIVNHTAVAATSEPPPLISRRH